MTQQDLFAPTSSRPGFHASPYPMPGSDEARRMTVGSGAKLLGSWTSSGPLGSLERTLLGSSTWASTKCFLTWKPWATPQGRLLFRLVPSMPRTDETEFGLWLPTPVANPEAPNKNSNQVNGPTSLGEAARLMATPTSKANQFAPSSPMQRHPGCREMWPTPRAKDGKAGQDTAKADRPNSGGHDLVTATALWPTPAARDWRSGKASAETHARNARPLNEMAAPTGSLNADWVEWLQGFPVGWTNLQECPEPSPDSPTESSGSGL